MRRRGRIDEGPAELQGKAAENVVAEWMRSLGYVVHIAEQTGFHRNGRHFNKPVDLWGCFDAIGVNEPDDSIWAVQVTTKTNVSHRRRKIEEIRWPLRRMAVSVARVEVEPDPLDRRRKRHRIFTQTMLSNRPEWSDFTAETIGVVTGKRGE